MMDMLAPFGIRVISPFVGEDPQPAIWDGLELKTRLGMERTAMFAEMVLRPGISLGFPMKIPILKVDPDGEPDFSFVAEIAPRPFRNGRPLESQKRGVFFGQHVRQNLDLDRVPGASRGEERPLRGRPRVNRA